MIAASANLEAVAGRVASYDATPKATQVQTAQGGGTPVRVAYLPLPTNMANPVEDMTSMMESEHAFKFNAVVFKTAADMLQSLYDAID
jgi:flagellar basal body rod protein FlgG